MPGAPSEVSCYQNLHSKFEFLFESELIKELCEVGSRSKYIADHIIIELGSEITHIPLLISGSIKVMMERGSDELLLFYLEVGDTCAVILKYGSGTNRSAIRAIAESDSEILFIPASFMEQWCVQYKSWRRYIFDSYNSRFKEMLGTIENLAFSNMENRLRAYLKDKVWIGKSTILNITHNDIAKDLNSSRVVISRLMKKLEKEGIFKQSRSKIEMFSY